MNIIFGICSITLDIGADVGGIDVEVTKQEVPDDDIMADLMAAAAAAKRNRGGGPGALAQEAPPAIQPVPPPPQQSATSGTGIRRDSPTKRTRTGAPYGGRPPADRRRKQRDN